MGKSPTSTPNILGEHMSLHMTGDATEGQAGGVSAPKQERSRRTREKIIDAAIQLFEERGFERTTSNDIAAAAGVSIGSFYAYFADKRQLLLFIFERIVSERIDAVFSQFTIDDLLSDHVRDRIRNAVKRVFSNKCTTPMFNRVLREMGDKDPDIASVRNTLLTRSITHLKDLFLQAQAAGLTNPVNAEIASTIIIHAVDAIASECVLAERIAEDEWDAYIDELTDMACRYVFRTKC